MQQPTLTYEVATAHLKEVKRPLGHAGVVVWKQVDEKVPFAPFVEAHIPSYFVSKVRYSEGTRFSSASGLFRQLCWYRRLKNELVDGYIPLVAIGLYVTDGEAEGDVVDLDARMKSLRIFPASVVFGWSDNYVGTLEYRVYAIWTMFSKHGSWNKIAESVSVEKTDIVKKVNIAENSGLVSFLAQYGEEATMKQWHDIATMLCTMHKKRIVHMDIKPGNVVIDESDDGCLHSHLIDFELAENVPHLDILTTNKPFDPSEKCCGYTESQNHTPFGIPTCRCHFDCVVMMYSQGSMAFVGPERLYYRYPFARDVFALGLTMLELLAPGHWVAVLECVLREKVPADPKQGLLSFGGFVKGKHGVADIVRDNMSWGRGFDLMGGWMRFYRRYMDYTKNDPLLLFPQYEQLYTKFLAPFYTLAVERLFTAEPSGLDSVSTELAVRYLKSTAGLFSILLSSDRSMRPNDAQEVLSILDKFINDGDIGERNSAESPSASMNLLTLKATEVTECQHDDNEQVTMDVDDKADRTNPRAGASASRSGGDSQCLHC